MIQKKINIVHIASWFPTASNPIQGIFIKEYIEGIAAFDQTINHIILTPFDTIPFLRHTLFKKESTEENRFHRITHNLFVFKSNLLFLPKISRFQYWKLIRKQFKDALNLFEGTFLVHSHVGFEAGLFANKIKKEFGTEYIITEHMSTFPFPTILRNKRKTDALRKAFTDAKKIISVSQNQADEIFDFCDCHATVIPNSINKNLFSTKEAVSKKGKVRFLTVGIPSHQKAIDVLLHAIQRLDARVRENSIFVIAGGGHALSEYQQMVKDLKLETTVNMIGAVPREKIPDCYQNADVFILVSRYESFGIVYIEALASGLPIIASKNGGAREIVTEKNGLLVNIEDIIETKDAIEFMFRNFRNYNPHDLREDFESRFSQETTFSKFISIYKSLTQVPVVNETH